MEVAPADEGEGGFLDGKYEDYWLHETDHRYGCIKRICKTQTLFMDTTSIMHGDTLLRIVKIGSEDIYIYIYIHLFTQIEVNRCCLVDHTLPSQRTQTIV